MKWLLTPFVQKGRSQAWRVLAIVRACLFLWVFANTALVESSTASARSNVLLTVDTNKPRTSTFSKGERAEAGFSVTGLKPGEATELHFEISDEEGNLVAVEEAVKLTATKLGTAYHTVDLPAPRLGYYEIRARLSDGTTLARVGTRPAGIVSYAVVPDPTKRTVYPASKTRFGLQGGFNSKAVVLPYLGARWLIRGGGFDWANLEPEAPGQFIAASHAVPPIRDGTYPFVFHGKRWETYFIATVTRASVPFWAGEPGTFGSVNKNFGALNEKGRKALPHFASEFAKRFKKDHPNQDVRYYQVTWEPNSGWGFGGTADQLVEIYRLIYDAIHDSDSLASVAGPTIHLYPSSTKQLRDLWKAGLSQHIDAFSIHPYSKWPPETKQLPSALRRQLRDANTAAGRILPFLGTEHGFRSTDVGLLQKAKGDIRSTIMILGEGASVDVGFYVHDFWFRKDPSDVSSHGFYWNLNPGRRFGSDKLGPKPVVPAYAAMTLFLDGAVSLGLVRGLTGTQIGYRFSNNGQTIVAVWDYATKSEYVISEGQTVCDWMGNCEIVGAGPYLVNDSPIYVFER